LACMVSAYLFKIKSCCYTSVYQHTNWKIGICKKFNNFHSWGIRKTGSKSNIFDFDKNWRKEIYIQNQTVSWIVHLLMGGKHSLRSRELNWGWLFASWSIQEQCSS
jgi:hypothetical protein